MGSVGRTHTAKRYKTDDCISAEGYTAKSLAELSGLIAGEGSFMLLIELEEDPVRALERIRNGFKIK